MNITLPSNLSVLDTLPYVVPALAGCLICCFLMVLCAALLRAVVAKTLRRMVHPPLDKPLSDFCGYSLLWDAVEHMVV